MIAAQPFDGENSTSSQTLCGYCDRVGGFQQVVFNLSGYLIICPDEHLNLWAAYGTGIGLGVETPIERVVVLLLAHWTEWESTHGRLTAIIGDILDDGEARTAIGAVDKRIAIASVC